MSRPLLIESQNLSHAWGRALLHVIDNPGTEISPLVVSITGFVDGEAQESSEIRHALDSFLDGIGEQRVHTVANTIFPQSLWRLAKFDRRVLFEIYDENLPRYKALSPSKNRRGLYFERLTAFGRGTEKVNQLEFIIEQYSRRSGVRKSMFQASIFDPAQDHDPTAQLPFPCLQHVSFVPDGGSLTMNAFYATQLLLEKAYGNFLGLCRLGHFMATEMGLTLSRMNCFIGVEKLDRVGKTSSSLNGLVAVVRGEVGDPQLQQAEA